MNKLQEKAEQIKAIIQKLDETHPVKEASERPETTRAGLLKENIEQFKVGETTELLFILKVNVDKKLYDDRLREGTASNIIDHIVNGLEIEDDTLVRQVGIDGYDDLTATIANKHKEIIELMTANNLI